MSKVGDSAGAFVVDNGSVFPFFKIGMRVRHKVRTVSHIVVPQGIVAQTDGQVGKLKIHVSAERVDGNHRAAHRHITLGGLGAKPYRMVDDGVFQLLGHLLRQLNGG